MLSVQAWRASNAALVIPHDGFTLGMYICSAPVPSFKWADYITTELPFIITEPSFHNKDTAYSVIVNHVRKKADI